MTTSIDKQTQEELRVEQHYKQVIDGVREVFDAKRKQQEPTKAMIDAAERIDWSDSDVRGNIINMWQAMCAAAPQPSKPLTDEQIQYAFRTNSVVIDDGNAYMVAGKRAINIARAIEAAHGIHAATQLKGDA